SAAGPQPGDFQSPATHRQPGTSPPQPEDNPRKQRVRRLQPPWLSSQLRTRKRPRGPISAKPRGIVGLERKRGTAGGRRAALELHCWRWAPLAASRRNRPMVRVGIAGIGFMGVTHFKAYQQVEGAQVAAIFTRDPKKLAGDWTNVRGNFGGAGGTQDLT